MALPKNGEFIGESAILVKPKAGKWLNPFFGYPSNEQKSVQGRISSESFSGALVKGGGLLYVFKTDTISMISNSLINSICTPDLGIILIYKKLPSVIIFGDLSDQKKIYEASNPK